MKCPAKLGHLCEEPHSRCDRVFSTKIFDGIVDRHLLFVCSKRAVPLEAQLLRKFWALRVCPPPRHEPSAKRSSKASKNMTGQATSCLSYLPPLKETRAWDWWKQQKKNQALPPSQRMDKEWKLN